MIRLLAAAVVATTLVSSTAFAQGTPRCPNILITFDVSGSMSDSNSFVPDGDPNTPDKKRYVVGVEAIAQLLSAASNFRYGLELFGDISTNSGTVNPGQCGISSPTCSYPTPPECNSVQSAAGTSDEINAVLGRLGEPQVAGRTPTNLAIEVAATRADMMDSQRPRYVLLVTDGDPTLCDGTSNAEAMNRTEAAIAALAQAGIKTYVVGFAGGTPANLNRMAIAGGTARHPAAECSTGNPCYYNAGNAAELKTALDAIVQVVGGEFGGSGCSDSCYDHPEDCAAGTMCKNDVCVADPCAGVTCGEGSVCVEGVCKAHCNETCRGATSVCDNGTCVAPIDCPNGCTGRFNVCVQGECQEDYCTRGLITCPDATYTCEKNACRKGTSGSGGTLPDGGVDPNADGDPDAIDLADASGCCSGAPGAFNLLGFLFALASLALLRPRSGV